jgi:hypothetical protein
LQSIENEGVAEHSDLILRSRDFNRDEFSYQIWPFSAVSRRIVTIYCYHAVREAAQGLLHALGRCFVFIDEADQALGKRDSGPNDSGPSGRVYSMIAKEMSDSQNRRKIVWVLATSRPNLIEVDL